MTAKKSVAYPERLRLVYLDECEVHTHPHVAKVWRRRGCVARVPAAGEDRKMAVFGAVDDASGPIIWQTSERKGEWEFMAFLDHLAATLPADIPTVIVLGNVGYHKSDALRVHGQRLGNRFRPCWLPAYAPHLNLMERVWRFLKGKRSNVTPSSSACHRRHACRAADDPAGRSHAVVCGTHRNV